MKDQNKPKIIIVLGQTSTGKSDLAVKIAKSIKLPMCGEIISADSRQIYKGLDIGSGKITKKEMKGVPHHLLSIALPEKRFSVAEYKALAEKCIVEILKRGNVPIICGGTGFYIDAITKGIIFPEVKPNSQLRKKLEKKSVVELFALLKIMDKKRARNIDKKNKRRIIRAIEIAEELGEVPSLKNEVSPYQFIKIGILLKDEVLKKRIKRRLLLRIRKGMVVEVRNLNKSGISWKRLEELGLEYKYVALYLQKKISKKEMIKSLQKEIFKFAKRQMTWFKRDDKILWIKENNSV